MSNSYDEELINTIYLYAYGILYLIVITIILIPIYIVVEYLILSIGLSRGIVLVLSIIHIVFIVLISNKYLLSNLIDIDFSSVSKINPVIYGVIAIFTLLLSLLLFIVNSIIRIYYLNTVSTILWIVYLTMHMYITYLFHKVFNNKVLGLSIIVFIVVILISFIIPIPYSYLLLFIPLVFKQYGLRNIVESIDRAIHGIIEEKGVFEQIIRTTAYERREIVSKSILESFRNIGKSGAFLLIASIVELVFILPFIFPYYTYVIKLPVLNIEPSYVMKIIVINKFTNWDLVNEYLPLIIVFTLIYTLVIALHIACIYAGLGKSTALLSTYSEEYGKLTLITYIASIMYASFLLLLILPMFIVIQIYTTGGLPEYAGELYSLFLNELYIYVPVIYVFLTNSVSLLITVLVISKVSRDFPSILLSSASNILPVIIFINTIRTFALIIELLGIQQFIWITYYIPLMTLFNLLVNPIIFIVITYGGYKLYSELYSEIVYEKSRLEY